MQVGSITIYRIKKTAERLQKKMKKEERDEVKRELKL